MASKAAESDLAFSDDHVSSSLKRYGSFYQPGASARLKDIAEHERHDTKSEVSTHAQFYA